MHTHIHTHKKIKNIYKKKTKNKQKNEQQQHTNTQTLNHNHSGDQIKPYIYEEEAWVVAAKQIKARSPNTTVVVWLDSFRIYTDNKTLNPDLGHACTTGHFRPARFLETHTEYLLKNASGQPALE